MGKSKSNYQNIFKAALATTVATGALVVVAPVYTHADAASVLSFSDVHKSQPYYEGVMALTARGVINGYLDGTYKPAENITRAHAAKIMALALGLDTKNVKNPGFTDINEKSPNYGPIAALVQADVISGFTDNTFRPNEKLTRAEMSKILVLGFDFEQATSTKLPFTDVNEKSWSTPYIQTLFTNKITTGTSATTFEPSELVTRGQMAAFIYRSENIAQVGTTAKVVSIEGDKVELSSGIFTIPADVKDLFAASNSDALKNAVVKYIEKDGVIQTINAIEITASGTAETKVVLDGNGATFAGNLTINGDYVSLKNLTVKGNLEIGKEVVNSFHGETVTVEGETIISDKTVSQVKANAAVYSAAVSNGADIQFLNAKLGSVSVSKSGSTIQMRGNSSVTGFTISSNASLQADDSITIPTLTISEGATNVTIDAPVDNLSLNTSGDLTVGGTGSINNATIGSSAGVSLGIKGKIGKLNVGSNGAKISLGTDTRVGDLVLPSGTEASDVLVNHEEALGNIENIGGEENSEVKPVEPVPPVAGGEVPLTGGLIAQDFGFVGGTMYSAGVGLTEGKTISDVEVLTVEWFDHNGTLLGTGTITDKLAVDFPEDTQLSMPFDPNFNYKEDGYWTVEGDFTGEPVKVKFNVTYKNGKKASVENTREATTGDVIAQDFGFAGGTMYSAGAGLTEGKTISDVEVLTVEWFDHNGTLLGTGTITDKLAVDFPEDTQLSMPFDPNFNYKEDGYWTVEGDFTGEPVKVKFNVTYKNGKKASVENTREATTGDIIAQDFGFAGGTMYSAGAGLTEGKTISDVEVLTVEWFDHNGTLLGTGTITDKLAVDFPEDTQLSMPFDPNFNYKEDGYWIVEGDFTGEPVKVKFNVTYKNGKKASVENTREATTGDIIAQDFGFVGGTMYSAGVGLTEGKTISDVEVLTVEWFDHNGTLLGTGTITDKLAVDFPEDTQLSMPFDPNFNYKEDGYWTVEGDFTGEPVKVKFNVTYKNGKKASVENIKDEN